MTALPPDPITKGMKLVVEGRPVEAAPLFAAVLAKDPDHPAALHGLGLTHYLARRYDQAVELLRRAVLAERNNPQYLANLAEALRRVKKPDEALKYFERCATLMPEHLKAHLGAANALRDLGRIEEAVGRYRLALALDPAFAEGYHYLGLTLLEKGRAADAVPLLRKAVSLNPRYTEAELTLAHALDLTGDGEGALAVYRGVLARDPKNVAAHNNLANILKNLGRFDEASAHYREALAAQPEHTLAYYNLSRTGKGEPGPGDAKAMQKLLEDPKLGKEERMSLHYGLGKIFDDLGDVERAFEHYTKAKAIDDRAPPFDGDEHTRLVDRTIATFTTELFSRRKGLGSDSEMPVFIVGMPRSGTTLVEQILGSHPRVYAAGELNQIGQFAERLNRKYQGVATYPEAAAKLDAVGAVQGAEEYLAALKPKAGGALRVTDKMPFNFMHLGLIALLFPKARVVHCRRDPMDNCLSCYFQYFTSVIPFTRDLRALGRYHADYRRLMDHWQKVLPLPILDVPYEEMVADQEGLSRRLLQFCGLEWDDACLGFHKTERTVKTASNWQVRQPIYKTSIGRWRAYEKFLGPLREALDAGENSPPPVSSASPAPNPGRRRAKGARSR